MRKVGDKVKLRDDYNGFFRDFKGQILTIEHIEPNDEMCYNKNHKLVREGGHWLKIKEFSQIDRYHLIKSHSVSFVDV